MRQWLTACIALLALAAWAAPATATVVASTTIQPTCNTAAGPVSNCADTTFYSTSPATDTTSFISGAIDRADPLTADFQTAFNDWNAANGSSWTLVNGGLLNLALTVTVAPGTSSDSGGISPIVVTLANYVPAANGPSLAQLAWTQALFTDYTPTAGLSRTPTITLDTYSLSQGAGGSGGAFTTACTPIPGPPNADNNTTPSTIGATPSGTAYCDPIYPFQYYTSDNGANLGNQTLSTDFFYDAPQGPWLTGAFRGITLLSTVTYDTNAQGAITSRVLTVYQGADYGFDLSSAAAANDNRTVADLAVLPEPATIATFGLGLAVALVCRVRSRRSHA